MIQTQRGMSRGGDGGERVSVCCPSCRTPAFKLARGVVLATAGKGVSMAEPCPKCGEIVRAVVLAAP